MAIAIKVENLDAVPEALRDEYAAQEDGTYRLKGTEGWESREQVKGLKSALQKERENVGARSTELNALKEQLGDLTPAQITELRAKAQQFAGLDPEQLAAQKAELDTQRASLQDTIATAVAAELDKAQAPLRAQIAEQQRVNAIAEAIAEEKGNATLLMPHVKAMTRVVETNGKSTVVVVDETGTPRVDAEGNPLTVKALVQQLRTNEIYAGAFAGSGNSGGGAGVGVVNVGGGTGGENTLTLPKTRSKMSVAQKAAFISAKGLDEFMRIPA